MGEGGSGGEERRVEGGEWKEGKGEAGEKDEEVEVEELKRRLRSATSVSRSRGVGEDRGGRSGGSTDDL